MSSCPTTYAATHVHAVSDHTSERLVYKRRSADLATEVEDSVGFLSLEIENKHAGHSGCPQERETSAHCIVVILIAKMATLDNLESPNQLQHSHWQFWQLPGETLSIVNVAMHVETNFP